MGVDVEKGVGGFFFPFLVLLANRGRILQYFLIIHSKTYKPSHHNMHHQSEKSFEAAEYFPLNFSSPVPSGGYNKSGATKKNLPR